MPRQRPSRGARVGPDRSEFLVRERGRVQFLPHAGPSTLNPHENQTDFFSRLSRTIQEKAKADIDRVQRLFTGVVSFTLVYNWVSLLLVPAGIDRVQRLVFNDSV